MREFVVSLFTQRMLVGWAIVAGTAVLVGYLDWFFVQELTAEPVKDLGGGIIVELNGALFDVVLFGVVVLWFDERRERQQRKRDEEMVESRRREDQERERQRRIDELRAQLSDFRGWGSEEAAKRTAGIVRRLCAMQVKVDAVRAHLKNADLRGLDLREANFTEANLMGVQLQGACLKAATLCGANLEHANLDGADLRGASFGRPLGERVSPGGTQLEVVWARDKWGHPEWGREATVRLLERTNLKNATLNEANLQGASLENACLDGALFYLANLEGAVLSGATVEGTRFADAQRGPADEPIPGWLTTYDYRLRPEAPLGPTTDEHK